MHHAPRYRQAFPAWIEENVRLPRGVTAEPGPIKLYPYQPGIAAAIGDNRIERAIMGSTQGDRKLIIDLAGKSFRLGEP